MRAAKDGRRYARPGRRAMEPREAMHCSSHPLMPRPSLSALAEKVARLKQAKAEAEAEIAAYKASREAQFQVFSKERMGDSAGHSSTLAKSTESELATIASDVAKNKQKVIDTLLAAVTTVA